MWRVPIILTTLLLLASTGRALPGLGGIGGCPTYWTGFGASCYRFFAVSLNWADAEEFCQSFSAPSFDAGADNVAHLVSIHSEEEQTFVYNYFDTSTKDDSNPEMWLGLNDREVEGTFEWTDGTALGDFTAWFGSNPDNWGPSGEDCTQMVMRSGLNWIDLPCTSTRHYLVCKMPLSPCY